MLATSTALAEALITELKQGHTTRVILSGISLGGWVANMHRAFFGTADAYIPVFAGAALDEVFISSAYRKLTDDRALEKAENISAVLNFEKEFSLRRGKQIFPPLARYDRFIEFQRQHRCYDDTESRILEAGHVTGTLMYDTIRQHILTHLAE